MSRRGRVYNRTTHRLREIERIVRHRHGTVLETDDADIVFDQVADCLLQMHHKKTLRWFSLEQLADRVKLWCERWAPWASILQCRDAARVALRRRRVDTADLCADRLRLSYAERTQLRITTIGAFDVNKRKRAKLRKERKRIRDRERQARKRAERGTQPRPQYLARSHARRQPWKPDGISRRTWERRRQSTNQMVNGSSRRQHDDTERHRPRAGRAADPRHRPGSRPAKEEVAERKLGPRQATHDATQSPSIKEVMVGDAPAPIAIDIRTNEEGRNDNRQFEK
jgi:hypothetical protein